MELPNTKSRAQLKQFFVKNAIPTEGNFADLIEAGIDQRDDGLIKSSGSPLSIEAGGDDTSQKRVLGLYRSFADEQPVCVLSLNPHGDPSNANSARAGLGIGDAAGNTRLYLDPATGCLGLNTVEPTGGLDIRSSSGGLWLRMGPGGGGGRVSIGYAGAGNPSAPVLTLSDLDDNPRIRFDKVGSGTEASPQHSAWIGMAGSSNLALMADRAGIGTETPQAKLHVHGGAIMPSAGDGENAGILFPRDPFGGGSDRAWLRYYARTGEAATLELGIANDADDHIALMPSGNVGIGTNAPTHKFHVKTDGAVGLFESTGPQAYLRFASNEGMTNRVEIACRPEGRLALWVAGAGDVFNITRAGNVGIGTNSPRTKLEVNGPIYCSNSDIYFTNTSHNHSGLGNTQGWAAIENAANYNALMILGRQTSEGRRVRVWDFLEIHGTFVNSSDLREKTDIEPLMAGLHAIRQLRPVSFRWTDKPNPHKSIGLIAQEVRSVIGDVVYDDGGTLSISYVGIIPVLINAVQELEQRLCEALEARESE